jgi:hypothetical protein
MLGSSHPANRLATNREACFVAPSPELRDRPLAGLKRTRGRATGPLSALLGVARTPRRLGFDDDVIIPPEEFALGTSVARIRDAAAERAPLRGTIRVVAVLVDFADKAMTTTADHIRDLFFSTPRQSGTTVYRLLTRLIRRPGAKDPDHEYVTNTAVDRHHRGRRYAPAGLIEYLDTGGPVVPVALARHRATPAPPRAEARIRPGQQARARGV